MTFLSTLQWYGQMTPWCFFDFREMAFKVLGGDLAKRLLGVGDLAKRLLGADSDLTPRSHWPDHPNTKEFFGQIIPL